MNWDRLERVGRLMALVAAGAGLAACGGGGGGGTADVSSPPPVSAPPPPVSAPPPPVSNDPTAQDTPPTIGAATEAKLSLSGLVNPDAATTGNAPVAQWSTQGAWSKVQNWAILAQHAVMIPDGRVLSFGADYVGDPKDVDYQRMVYSVWDPKTNTLLRLPNGTDVNAFCAAQVVLPNGKVSILGGEVRRKNTLPDNTVFYDNYARGNPYALDFDPLTGTPGQLTQSATNMNRSRWYPTPTTLLDGEVLIQGGMLAYGPSQDPTFPSFVNAIFPPALTADLTNTETYYNGETVPKFAEVRATDGTFRELTSAQLGYYLDWYYPRNWVLPDNTIFGMDTSGKFFRLDPRSTGGIKQLQTTFNDAERTGYLKIPALGFGIERSQTAVMYDKNKILGLGGATLKAFTLDISPVVGSSFKDTQEPTYKEVGPLNTVRRWANSTVLPNGQVVVTGGAAYDPSSLTETASKGIGDAAVSNDPTKGVAKFVELWDPAKGLFTKGASEQYARLYHATAMLLPDGTVLSAGGGFPGPRQPGFGISPSATYSDLYSSDAQIYFPPYLFKADGSAADRPVIYGAPSSVAAGAKFSVWVGDTSKIDRVVLIKTSSVTHSYNFEQRLIKPKFAIGAKTGQLVVTLPGAPGEPADSKLGETPPGYYMVFVIDKSGVPSIAKIMRIEALSSAQVAALSSHDLVKGARFNPRVVPTDSAK